MKAVICSSWKIRDRVRKLAEGLRALGYEVYDFTDPKCRETQEIPPERFPNQFDPEIHRYNEYICQPEWKAAVNENKKHIDEADLVILLLPCGNDAHADWAYGIGKGIRNVVIGHPNKGERSPVHNWAQRIFDNEEQFLTWFQKETKCIGLSVCGGGCESCMANL